MSIIIVGLVVVVVVLFPVMFAAKKLGAEKSDLVDVLIAVVASTFVVSIFAPMLPAGQTNEAAFFTYSLLLTGLVYKYVLQASYLIAVLIALMAVVIRFLITWVLGAVL